MRVESHRSSTRSFVMILLLVSLVSSTANAVGSTADIDEERQKYLDNLEMQDTCGTIYTSELHGYQVKEYELTTQDNYKLKLHRLIHPEDQLNRRDTDQAHARGAQEMKLRSKKPYLLVHGLIGTSASFVLNIKDAYKAPEQSYRAKPEIISVLKSQAKIFKHEYESTATRLNIPSEQTQRDIWSANSVFADLNNLDYDGDEINFAKEYRQAYRKFHLPRNSLNYTTSSLAFTLSNFGYDVWMINLRGNEYSKDYNGRLKSTRDEYWNFDIGTLAREDFMAAIKHIQQQKGLDDPIGLVTHSYSAAYVMELLTNFPAYAERLQPIVMMAPTLLTKAKDRKQKSRFALRGIDLVLSKNGPFPSKQRSLKLPKINVKNMLHRHNLQAYAAALAPNKLDDTLAKLICKLPIALQLCRFMENVIFGKTESVSTVRGLLLPGPEKQASELMRRDSDCGRTSKKILHQIFDNIRKENVPTNFMVFESITKRQQQQKLTWKAPLRGPFPLKEAATFRRSVILIHAQDDEVATPGEIERIRSTALKTVTLLDYIIKTSGFGHTDFLFSHRNQFLVNAEIARQVLLFDFLAYQSYANQPSEVPRGI